MRDTFEQALSAVLKHEGGYVDHPSDPGGATNMGITHKTLARWRKVSPWWDLAKSEIKALTRYEASDIYKASYWAQVRGDDLPSGIDYAVFDYAVNSGPDRAARTLQSVLGVGVDGAIGPQTLAAARKADAKKVVEAICDQRLAFLKRLKTWPTFGKGWASRVAGVRALAVTMAQEAPVAPPKLQPAPKPEPIPTIPPPEPAKPKKAPWGLIITAVFIAAVLAAFLLPIFK